jgi:hypothetical protein
MGASFLAIFRGPRAGRPASARPNANGATPGGAAPFESGVGRAQPAFQSSCDWTPPSSQVQMILR